MQRQQTCRLKWQKMQLRGHWNFAGEGHLQHVLAALSSPARAFMAVKVSSDAAKNVELVTCAGGEQKF